MERSQKIIVALLVLAILFSAMSIAVSFSVFSVDVPQKSNSQSYSSGNSAGLGFVVEENGDLEGRG